jgi:hypothetical protein
LNIGPNGVMRHAQGEDPLSLIPEDEASTASADERSASVPIVPDLSSPRGGSRAVSERSSATIQLEDMIIMLSNHDPLASPRRISRFHPPADAEVIDLTDSRPPTPVPVTPPLTPAARRRTTNIKHEHGSDDEDTKGAIVGTLTCRGSNNHSRSSSLARGSSTSPSLTRSPRSVRPSSSTQLRGESSRRRSGSVATAGPGARDTFVRRLNAPLAVVREGHDVYEFDEEDELS